MPEFGFPAQSRNASMARLIADLRSRGDDARVAAVTGRFADVTAERNGHVNELMQIEKSISDLSIYAQSIALTEARTGTMQESLEVLKQNAQSIADTSGVVLTNGSEPGFKTLSYDARSALNSLVNALNVDFAGRALFAGDDAGGGAIADADTVYTTSVPFLEAAPSANAAYATLQAEFMNLGATFDTAFYIGGAGQAPVTEVAPGERVDYTVKANEAANRGVLFNMTVMAAAYDETNAIPADQRRDLVDQAATGLRSAITQLIDLQSRLGTSEARVADVKARNIATDAAFTIRFNELASADEYESALTLTELDRQLETAFATTARLSNLTLTNFI